MSLSLFGGTDWLALGWATSLAALTGWSNMRIRERDAHEDGDPPASAADVIADTLIGTSAGLVLALIVPDYVPKLHTLGGITALACLGGVGGRRIYDLGLALLEWFAKLKIGYRADDSSPPPKAKEGDKPDA